MSESETIHKKQIPQLNDKSKDRKKESNFAVKRINNDDYNSKRTDAYGTYNIVFQAQGRHETRADYVDVESGLIIDAKYKTWYSFSDNQKGNPIEDIRQLSGYARDLKIIKQMNVSDPEKYIPPCIIIYPNSDGCENFQGKTLKELSDKNSSNNPLSHFVNFYKVGVKLPTLK